MADLIPHRLMPGDMLGVIAPSDPVLADQENNLQMGIQYLQAMGFQVKCGANIHANTLGFAASPQEKAEDINQMFADPEVKAIICAQGGDTANAPLTLINWEVVQRNPKIFLGLSDITVLLNAIYHRIGLVTFHGNDILWGFGNNLVEYERSEIIRTLIEAEIGPIPPHGGRSTVRGGKACGKLLGGNLRCLLKLAGTTYWPDFSGAILFLEAYEISASACHTALLQMQHMGVFDQIHGAVVGYIYSMQHNNSPRPHMEDILLEITHGHHFPIMKMDDFGHVCPNTVMPVGGEVFLDADILSLELISPVVR